MNKKLKICLHGIVGGKSGKDGQGGSLKVEKLYDHFYKRVILPNKEKFDVQVFVHCWSLKEKNNILELFKPSKEVFEKSKFKSRHRSKLYSMFKSIEISDEGDPFHEDVLLSCRFDTFYKKDLDISQILEESISQHQDRDVVIFPQDDPRWKRDRVLNSIRLQDQFFIGYVNCLYPFFKKDNYHRVDNNIKEKNILIYSPNPHKNRRRVDNHRIARNIFENEREFISTIGDLSRSDIVPVLDRLRKEPGKLEKTLNLKILKSNFFISQVDFDAARNHSQFY